MAPYSVHCYTHTNTDLILSRTVFHWCDITPVLRFECVFVSVCGNTITQSSLFNVHL